MKKALTIYVDDDMELIAYNATFLCAKNDADQTSTTMQTVRLDGHNAVYIPWENKDGALPYLITEDYEL